MRALRTHGLDVAQLQSGPPDDRRRPAAPSQDFESRKRAYEATDWHLVVSGSDNTLQVQLEEDRTHCKSEPSSDWHPFDRPRPSATFSMSSTPRLSPSDAVFNALMGTLLTWAVTAAGAGGVYLALPSKRLLDTALGFAAGVMLAASYWSLLAPALEMADASGTYGQVGRWGERGRRGGGESERTEERG